MSDNRVGVKDNNGAVIAWPERSISGLAYARPCTMVGLDEKHFVVVDMWPMPGYKGEIEKLKVSVAGMNAPPRKPKVGDGA